MRGSWSRFIIGSLIGCGLGLIAVVATTLPVLAHVDLVASTPANVSVVTGSVTEIRFEFSGDVEPVNDKFAIEDAAGGSVDVVAVENDGGPIVVVRSAEALPDGRTKVFWALRGLDGHTMSGSVAFTVSGSPSGAPSVDAVVGTASRSSSAGSSTDGVPLAEWFAVLARWTVYGAVLFAAGAIAFATWVHRGPRSECRWLIHLIRRAAVVVVIGSIVEWCAQLVDRSDDGLFALLSPSAWGDLLSSGFAMGTLFRLVGAGLVLRFIPIDAIGEANPHEESINHDWLSASRVTSTGRADVMAAPLTRVRVESGPLAVVGVALLLLSESFIGHTASVDPQALMLVSNFVHLSAAGVWAAGVWLLALTLWRRQRRGEESDGRRLGLRLSFLATWALVAVALSGVVLGWSILGEVSRLWTSQFGRLLLLKVSLVSVIGFFGLHNRRSVLPALERQEADAGERFRRTMAIESALFVVVLLVTSLLVIASPTTGG